MRYYIDTEFLERGPGYPIDLISIGVVAEDGREFYAINWDAPLEAIRRHDWLMDNVVPSLPLRMAETHSGDILAWDVKHSDWRCVMPRRQIAMGVTDFFRGTKAELWGWYSAYDHVVLAQIYGPMADLPPWVPMWTNDLKQEVARLGNPRVPTQKAGEHNALADARWNREVATWLTTLAS